jgi:hypothetical protein
MLYINKIATLPSVSAFLLPRLLKNIIFPFVLSYFMLFLFFVRKCESILSHSLIRGMWVGKNGARIDFLLIPIYKGDHRCLLCLLMDVLFAFFRVPFEMGVF